MDKSKSNYRFFAEAEEVANQKYNNMDGNADEVWEGFDDEVMNANGGDAGSVAITSQPYIINVTNTTLATISNVLVLGANDNLAPGVVNFGNVAGITITMGIANVSYAYFLQQTQQKPFLAGLTYIQSANPTQALETISVSHKQANGNLCYKTIVPVIDPYQNQNTSIAVKQLYTADGGTMFTLSNVYASTTAKIYIYPANVIDTRRGLAGQNVEAKYADPKIVKSQTVTISGAALKALGR